MTISELNLIMSRIRFICWMRRIYNVHCTWTIVTHEISERRFCICDDETVGIVFQEDLAINCPGLLYDLFVFELTSLVSYRITSVNQR